MKLEPYIKPKSYIFRFIPWFSNGTANSVYPFIFVPLAVYENLKLDNPDPKCVALLIHEKTHYERQKRIGILKFAIKYILSSNFRLNEELIAVKEAMKYLKSQGLSFDFDNRAKMLSSWLYLWPVSKIYVEKQLKDLWDSI